jgi:predicted oxidoreductase
MERSVLERIPELQALLEALRKGAVADLTWTVLGGFPARYVRLNTIWEGMRERLDVVAVVEDFLDRELLFASYVLRLASESNPSLASTYYSRFKTVDEIRSLGLERVRIPTIDTVVRRQRGEDYDVYVPATPAMALVLRHGVTGKLLSLKGLRRALGEA